MRREDAGIGAEPAIRASLASVAKRWISANSARTVAAVRMRPPVSARSCGATSATRTAGSRWSASIVWSARGCGAARQARSVRARSGRRAGGARRRGSCQHASVRIRARISNPGHKVMQVPAQVINRRGALRHESLRGDRRASGCRARGTRARDGKGVESFPDCGPLAIATASMASDLPRSRAERRAPAMSLAPHARRARAHQ